MQETYYQTLLKDYKKLNKVLNGVKQKNYDLMKSSQQFLLKNVSKEITQKKEDKTIEDISLLDNFIVENTYFY